MPKLTQVQLNFVPSRLQKLRNLGVEHYMKNTQGAIKNATIVMNIVNFVLDLRHDPIIIAILKKKGGNLLSLINEFKTYYAEKHGYLNKRKY